MEIRFYLKLNHFFGIFLFIYLFVYIETEDVSTCPVSPPPNCECSNIPLKYEGNRFRIKCGGGKGIPPVISSIEELQFHLLDNIEGLVNLDLSSNTIKYLPTKMFSFPDLQKLDLSNNSIEKIEDGAFLNLSSLKRLDLSNNKIVTISKPMFDGLTKLERLVLNYNRITTIKNGTLEPLVSLKKLDVTGNGLVCDCELLWLSDLAYTSMAFKLSNTTCAEPSWMRDQPFKKFKSDALYVCNMLKELEISPQNDQVVFEGDSMRLDCRLILRLEKKVGSDFLLRWHPPDSSDSFRSLPVTQNDLIVESSIVIDKIDNNHTGKWNCEAFALDEKKRNFSQSVSLMVISSNTKYCKPTVTVDNRGRYQWPHTLAGEVAELPCAATVATVGMAMYTCSPEAVWTDLNTSVCPYLSESTRILHQFAKMNLVAARGTIFESAKKLHNYTLENKKNLVDKMDIVFIAQTINNYLEYLSHEKDLGSILLDLISHTMDFDAKLLSSAQLEDRSCSKLINAIEKVTPYTAPVQSSKWNMAVGEFPVSRESFLGMTCTWWNSRERNSVDRLFTCSPSNKSGVISTLDKILEASIEIPASLFQQLEMRGKPATAHKLFVAMFDNANFFPFMYNSSKVVSSPVVGAKLGGVEVDKLRDHLTVTIGGLGDGSSPAWWDEKGGQWTPGPCRPSQILHHLLVLHCTSLGYFALASTPPAFSTPRLEQARSRPAPVAIFVGTSVGTTCLLIAIFTYVIYHNSIQMSGKMKHALPNSWLALSLLAIFFTHGIYQTEGVKICQAIGLVLHYLTLCSLFWMAVSINCMHRSGSKVEVVSSEELGPAPPAPHPALGLYLVGWGVPALLVGLSGAVNPAGYATPRYCSLGPGPGFTPVIVPVGAVFVFIFTRALMVRSAAVEKDSNAQLSEGTQATDLELLETVPNCADRGSLHSVATPSSHVEDLEHPPYLQLKASMIVVLLFTIVWTSAALSVLKPFNFFFEEAVFGVTYAVFFIVLGVFVAFFYCFSRSDVRSVWFTTKHIIRSRNVTDLQPISVPPLNSRNSINSSTGRKSISPRPEPQGEVTSKTNFVDLHRRQYHSNNVINEPNTFYNPHQSIVARKFFKKQRRKQNNLGTRRSGDGATPMSPDTSELFHLGSKVNNANIHVELPTPQSIDLNILNGGRPLERLVIGAESNEPVVLNNDGSVKYASVASECCSCMVSEAHSATDCTLHLTSDHSSRSSHLYATVAPDMSPYQPRKNPRPPPLSIDFQNEVVRIKLQEPVYTDVKSSDEDKKETSV